MPGCKDLKHMVVWLDEFEELANTWGGDLNEKEGQDQLVRGQDS